MCIIIALSAYTCIASLIVILMSDRAISGSINLTIEFGVFVSIPVSKTHVHGVDDGERRISIRHMARVCSCREHSSMCASSSNCVRWRSLVGVVTHVSRHVLIGSLVRWYYTCGSRRC